MEFLNIAGVKISIVGAVEKVTESIKEKLKTYDDAIYWNDSTCKHWMFDFKIEGVWFENIEVNNTLDHITLYVY